MPSIIIKNTPPPKEKAIPTTPIMVDTPKAFRLVLDNAARGQKIIYYEGDLAFDREFATALPSEAKSMISRLAECAYNASERNKVHLFQARLGPFKFQYIAVVR